MAELTDELDNGAIVKIIISMAHTFCIAVVADGVETESRCLLLMQNMCNEIAGPLFSTPVIAAALAALLEGAAILPTPFFWHRNRSVLYCWSMKKPIFSRQ